MIWPRRQGIQYFVDHTCVRGTDRFVITHNLGDDGLPTDSFAVVDAPVAEPTDIATLIDHRADIQVQRIDAFANYLVVSFRRNGLPAVGTIDVTTAGYGPMSEIVPTGHPRALNVWRHCAWEQPSPRIELSSITFPPQVLELDTTGTMTPIWTRRVPTGFDASAYEARREWAVASDGTRIPISLFAQTEVLDRGPAPLFIASYGSYGVSYDPCFRQPLLSLIDRGVVVGIAHIRGGGEYGRRWHRAGSALNRVNSITDYLDCIEHLTSRGFAERGRIVGSGKSAGGLIVGAAVNIDPEMFAGVLALVPNVDPLTTMLNPAAPLTNSEWDEWGNPVADKAAYDLMKSYSPYENVSAQPYPAILATAGLHDVRVSYAEPAKWVARLRESTTGDADILLNTDIHASHAGPSGHLRQCEQAAFEFAWVIDILGLADPR
jgi:oligopeptidase B